MQHTVEQIRQDFFELIFGDEEGMLCIATIHKDRGKTSFKRYFFQWPLAQTDMLAFIASKERAHDVYFSTAIFSRSRALKEFARPTKIVWADLDTCKPEDVSPTPPIVLETSPGRFHALWTLIGFVQPEIAEEYARNLTYQYAPEGADKSGWDIGQLLRVPLTHNFKKEYQAVGGEYPTVGVVRMLDLPVPDEVFESLPVPEGRTNGSVMDVGMPDLDSLPKAEDVIQQHWPMIEEQGAYIELFETEPETSDDWSKKQWRLIHMSLEAGMTPAETFAVVKSAKCNKYARDNRPDRYLWMEVTKAHGKQRVIASYSTAAETFTMPQIYEEGEATDFTFVDMYREWGEASTDAPPQFHDMGAFIVMSSLMAANLQLPLDIGKIRPNLWGLVLGESTFSRKTTTTRMAMELIASVDGNILLATDGSVEGIVSGMAGRSNEVSVFFRDEVSGFFDSMSKREYLSGMQEMMTYMYDVPPKVRRTLRKETIIVENPLFIFFGGGIRERTYAALMQQSVTSGFLPRFLIVCGDVKIDDVKLIGPPKPVGTGFSVSEKSKPVMQHAHDMYNIYHRTGKIRIPGEAQDIEMPIIVDVELTTDAWERAQQIEDILNRAGHDTALKEMMAPTMIRLYGSLLKMAMLIGASRQEPKNGIVTVEKRDVLSAAKYIQQWGVWSVDAVLNVGKGIGERELAKVLRAIRENPGIQRKEITRNYHLTKKQMDEIVATLLDRGHIRIERVNNATHYTALD